MIEQPLPDRKRDYWGTIFNTVVPDDNAGKVTGRTVNQENNILMLLCFSCDEEPRQPPLPQVRRRSEARAEIQSSHAENYEGDGKGQVAAGHGQVGTRPADQSQAAAVIQYSVIS